MTTKPTTSDMTVAEILRKLCDDDYAAMQRDDYVAAVDIHSEALAAIKAHYAAKTEHDVIRRTRLARRYMTHDRRKDFDEYLAERLNNTEEQV